MFTGLVQATGRLVRRTPRGPGFRVEVSAELGPLELGESIAVNGVCLSVASRSSQGFEADVSVESVTRTTLGSLTEGAPLNLERSLRAGDRLGGHFVLGHVDGTARVERVAHAGAARRVSIRPPAELVRFIAPKGSVALDGVSLTVNATHSGIFEIMLIPHTLQVTNFASLVTGALLNIEVDPLARYAVHWLEASATGARQESGLVQALERAGWSP